MRQDPIKFRNIYEDMGEGCYFKACTDDKGNYIYRRDVIIEPFVWQSGSSVKIEIEEHYTTSSYERKTRTLFTNTFFDRDYMEHKEIMDALCSGMVNGSVAEGMANKLFYILFSDSETMKKYLPKVWKFYNNLKTTGNPYRSKDEANKNTDK